MAWNYDPTKLNESPKDQVRLRIGDTVQLDPLLQDEEIQFFITSNPTSIDRVCVQCIDAILVKAANTPDYSLGPYSESNKGRLDGLRQIKRDLLYKIAGLNAPIAILPTTEPTFEVDMMNSKA